ncbi:MAG: hypothetical protein K8R77_12475 [Anaerolineaceae bacterium]|nr:hypothetical protein [Anaerolineaceae bacterium]
MSSDVRKGIYNNLNQKDMDELLAMWQTNDRVEWTEEAFDVMQEILQARLGEVPSQNKPVLEHVKEELFDEDALEQIVGDQDPPVFYKPKEVLWLDTWLKHAAITAAVISFIKVLLNLGTTHDIVFSYNFSGGVAWEVVSWLIAIVVSVLGAYLQIVLVYFPLKALGAVLKILMEMEFNSRGVK